MKKFLLLLLLTTYPIFSQDSSSCPQIENLNQVVCASEGTGNNYHLPMIKDLEGIDLGGGLFWYADANSQEPLGEDHLLENGANYFAGNPSCSERVEITVTIMDSPNAGATTFLEFCNTAEPVDVLSLMKPSILGAPETGGYFVPEFSSGTTIFDPAVDVSGTYVYHVESSNNTCPDDKAVVYITVNPTPGAGEDRTITLTSSSAVDLNELLGEGVTTNGNWNPAFTSGTSVFDPQVDALGAYTYSVTSGNCEDSATITIASNPTSDPEENCPIVSETIQTFCESEGTGNNYYRPAIKHLAAQGEDLAWYATADSNKKLSPDQLLINGVTYYAGDGRNTCSARVGVTVNLANSPNAGATTFLEFCNIAEPVDVLSLMKPSILGAPDTGGYFVPEFSSGTTIFDPAVDVSGTYVYHVESSNNTCPDDKAVVYITVNPTPGAGEDRTITLTSSSAVDLNELLGEGVTTNGNWNPAFTSGTSVFDPQVDALGAYNYSVTSGNCEDSATITIASNPTSDPEENCPIVSETIQTFCESEGTGNNFYRPAIKHLAAQGEDLAWYATADSNEKLSPDQLLINGVTYYAGDGGNTCSARVGVTVNLEDSPNAGRTTHITVNNTDEAFNIVDVMEPSILGSPDAGGSIHPPLNSGTTIFNPAVDTGGQYIYTVKSPNSFCPDDSAVIYITVNSVSEEVSVYPNPTNGVINVKSQEPILSIRILDMTGNVVHQEKNDQHERRIDISKLNSSMYLMEVTTKKGKRVKRVIKN